MLEQDSQTRDLAKSQGFREIPVSLSDLAIPKMSKDLAIPKMSRDLAKLLKRGVLFCFLLALARTSKPRLRLLTRYSLTAITPTVIPRATNISCSLRRLSRPESSMGNICLHSKLFNILL